ncbi:hypothetical protein OE88DRAFT_619696 [Heliocybe sulcata]|uniref:Uncharacterized protein n=1 Tax=Heliocybe sulcata TaxID=5364 RepID=A0A5C3NC87_9AGAM|nr:hypothetical protein OE88DRAFT_619696 [Heliocybe sulcata]
MSAELKRKRQESEDSDDEEPSFGRQILPVANLPHNYNGPIEDGLQYLFTVRRDARRLPHVTRVVNPYEMPDVPGPLKDDTPHPSLPSELWRTVFERRFRNFRKNSVQPTIHVQRPGNQPKQKLMPDKHERDLWWEFVAGQPEAVWNPPKKPKQAKGKVKKGQGMRGFSEDFADYDDSRQAGGSKAGPDDGNVTLMYGEEDVSMEPVHPQASGYGSLPTPSGTPSRPEDGEIADTTAEVFIPREPTPALLNRIDHRLAIHLLVYFTNWLNHYVRHPEHFTNRLTDVHARWIFALLSRVDDYVGADDMSIIRNLARACIGLLKEQMWKKTLLAQAGADLIAEDVMSERSCWMVIAAVVDVWAQRDLWQDAEAMLKDLNAQ